MKSKLHYIPILIILVITIGIYLWLKRDEIAPSFFGEQVRLQKVPFNPNVKEQEGYFSAFNLFGNRDRHVVSLPKQDVYEFDGDIIDDDNETTHNSKSPCAGYEKEQQLDDGTFRCVYEDAVELPTNFSQDDIGIIIQQYLNKLYKNNIDFTFEKNVFSDVIIVHNRPPENSQQKSSDLYIGTLRNENGEVTAIVGMENVGVINGKAQFEPIEHFPQGAAYQRIPPEVSEQFTSLEEIQAAFAYKPETFPPVNDTMATGFVNDYLKENNVTGVSIEHVGYTSAYDYRGRVYGDGPATAFHEYMIKDAEGNESTLLVNIDDGRIVDADYLKWLTEENDFIESLEPFSQKERGVEPPQQSRYILPPQ